MIGLAITPCRQPSVQQLRLAPRLAPHRFDCRLNRLRTCWAEQVIPARYYLYSFQDIPAGPSIFQSIFQHILEYMDTDSPSRCVQSSKIAKNSTEPPKVAPKQLDRKWTLLAKGSSSFVLLTRFELFGSSLEAPSQSKVFPVTRSRV